jgi:hypothetical protein
MSKSTLKRDAEQLDTDIVARRAELADLLGRIAAKHWLELQTISQSKGEATAEIKGKPQ